MHDASGDAVSFQVNLLYQLSECNFQLLIEWVMSEILDTTCRPVNWELRSEHLHSIHHNLVRTHAKS